MDVRGRATVLRERRAVNKQKSEGLVSAAVATGMTARSMFASDWILLVGFDPRMAHAAESGHRPPPGNDVGGSSTSSAGGERHGYVRLMSRVPSVYCPYLH